MKDKEVYEKTLELFDYHCGYKECQSPFVQCHHIRYGNLRGGRKTYMGNVIPLCPYHHRLVHTNKKKYMNELIKIVDERIKNE